MQQAFQGLFSAPDPSSLGRLKQALADAGYTRDNVRSALQTDEHLLAKPGEVVVVERRLEGRAPLPTLIKFFLIGLTVDPSNLVASLPSLPYEQLQRLGLVEAAQGGVRCPIRLSPHGDILLASDRSYYKDEDRSDSHVVTGASNPATLLADLTVRKRVRRALDLGTGGGIQALLLANHCDTVIATDVNPRALDYTRLNAALNGFRNIETRLGSWFEPVEGERFDLVTANPPYVMSPESTFLYRDSGMAADSLCRQLVREMPHFLEDGGFGHILISWALAAGQDWSEPLRSWVDGLGCDVWLLHYLTDDPLTQASKWNRPLALEGHDRYEAAIDRWMDYYRRSGIDQIAFGAVIMRRRSTGETWLRTDSLHAAGGSASGLVSRVFEAEDFLRRVDDEQLLDERFSLVAGHRLEQRLVARDGAWQLDTATLMMSDGLGFRGGLDLTTAQLVGHLDGRHTLREAVEVTCRELEVDDADRPALTETAVAMARRLHQLGFVSRGDESPNASSRPERSLAGEEGFEPSTF